MIIAWKTLLKLLLIRFFSEILKEMPDYVQHYDAEYWAAEIMNDIMAR